MQKILLVGINSRYTHSNLAIRYLRNSLSDLPYHVELAETSINTGTLEIIDDIFRHKPDFLLLSVYIWNHETVAAILPDLRKMLPGTTFILGGPEVSYNPQTWLKRFPSIDHIISGRGEYALRQFFCDPLLNHPPIIKVQNPAFNKIPFPYLDSDFPDLKDKYIYYESSRGCVFKCSYCISSRQDQPQQIRSLKHVKQELSYLIDKKPGIIKFIDRTFNLDPARAREIWRFLNRQAVDPVSFHFEIRPDLLEEKDFLLLKKVSASRFRFEIGIQSTNPLTLDAIERSGDPDIICRNAGRLTAMGNVHTHLDLIAGLPYEDIISLRKTFNDIYLLGPNQLQFGFLKLLPGTRIRQEAEKFEYVYSETPPYQVLANEWISSAEMVYLRRFEKVFSSLYNRENLIRTLENITSLFSDPFTCFEQLTEFAAETDSLKGSWNWHQKAKLIFDFTRSKHPDKLQLIIDCLRWDWCSLARSHYYPSVISLPDDNDIKRSGYEYLKHNINKDRIVVPEGSFPKQLLNRTIFFKALSREFHTEYDCDNRIVCFLPADDGKTQILI